MAKRKETTNVAAKNDTKKLKQVVRKSTRSKAKTISENGIVEKEAAKKPKAKSQRSKKAEASSARNSSKYFEVAPAVKEEPESMSEDGEDVTPPFAESSVEMKEEKEEEEENDEEEEESEEDEDWEEVEELAEPLGPVDPLETPIPSQPVEIEIETPDITRRRQKKEKKKAEFEAYLRRMMNRFNKELLEDTHKVHLLCLLANGLFRNNVCSEPDLLAVSLSMLPSHFTTVSLGRINAGFLNGLIKWFGVTFTLNPLLPEEKGMELRDVLEKRLGSLSARDHQEMTHLLLLMLRSLGLFCRLVLSLQPVPLKPPSAKASGSRRSKSPPQKSPSDSSSPEPKISPGVKRPAAQRGGEKGERGGKKQKKKAGGEEVGTGAAARPKNTKRRSVASKVSYKEESSEEEEEERHSEEEFQLSSEDESDDSGGGAKKASKKKTGKGKGKAPAPRRSRGVKKEVKSEEEEDEDEEEVVKKGKRRTNAKGGEGKDEWLEVYLEGPSKWISVDVDEGVMEALVCSRRATQPLTYVVGVDGAGYIKDLGSKYDPTWLTSSRKRRVDPDWWEETLEFYECPDSERERQEDKELQDKLLEKPMPTSITEFKNHPLYALKRHLLKYEAIYPPTATILGYCRGEPVYSRDCVHTLHSRDTWLKEARTVRLGEEPYKMVRGFSNRSRKARMMSENKEEKDLPLFGHWQTEEYQPPIAINGRVPRNDFGNVYMFKDCMLPVGCVHMRLPNLHRVARKLNIDSAAAVTGFDFHGGYSHAVTDGYIVCEEHEEVLRAAWENEQEILQKKEKEKKEKRAVANWTLLVKGLLIRERLQRRYGQQGMATGAGLQQGDKGGVGELSSGEEEEEEGVTATAPPTLASSWPQNRQQEPEEEGSKKPTTRREKRGQQKHLFPFEKV
ncbi:DNA repair protein complementing XP-C cells [Chanos chanos]|uniref:DNA repair protein complementing XP-C cells n=1 Tax=Chanos chanos TaxID=29144 RepID=A0A6J2W8B0_CHACN|nr:DNA repair protein complementing XP-C cells [Chanos chanos]